MRPRMWSAGRPGGAPGVASRNGRTGLFLGLAAVLGGTAACASTGATFRSGVGETFLEHPPYYAGEELRGIDPTLRIGHLPIAYQRGASQAPIFDPAASGPMQDLLGEMNAWLDSLGVTARLVEGGRVSAVTHAATTTPPDVQFGCLADPADPDGDCAERDDDQALGRGYQPLRLAVGRPSPEWTAWVRQVMEDHSAALTLVITVEVGQYLLRQEGLRGTKVLELGTSHVARLPWLTSLETPVPVVQLTGALVGPDGRAVRIGAEGLLARRTPLLVSSFGGQALITDEDVEELRVARRDDLPDRPRVWEAGLGNLVAQLTGRGTAGSSR